MSTLNTLFDIQEIFGEINASGGTKLPVGKHDDVKLANVELGDTFIDFHFEKDGKVANKRIWHPNPSMIFRKQDRETQEYLETEEQALIRDGKDSLRHIIKIMRIFLGDEVVKTFQPSTFADACKRAATMLNAAKDKETVNLLIIYDKTGQYPDFGKYPNYIEKHVEGIPNGLKPSKWEMENRMTPAELPNTDVKDPESVGDNVY